MQNRKREKNGSPDLGAPTTSENGNTAQVSSSSSSSNDGNFGKRASRSPRQGSGNTPRAKRLTHFQEDLSQQLGTTFSEPSELFGNASGKKSVGRTTGQSTVQDFDSTEGERVGIEKHLGKQGKILEGSEAAIDQRSPGLGRSLSENEKRLPSSASGELQTRRRRASSSPNDTITTGDNQHNRESDGSIQTGGDDSALLDWLALDSSNSPNQDSVKGDGESGARAVPMGFGMSPLSAKGEGDQIHLSSQSENTQLERQNFDQGVPHDRQPNFHQVQQYEKLTSHHQQQQLHNNMLLQQQEPVRLPVYNGQEMSNMQIPPQPLHGMPNYGHHAAPRMADLRIDQVVHNTVPAQQLHGGYRIPTAVNAFPHNLQAMGFNNEYPLANFKVEVPPYTPTQQQPPHAQPGLATAPRQAGGMKHDPKHDPSKRPKGKPGRRASGSKRRNPTSLQIFERFVKISRDPQGVETTDSSGILSRECFETWIASRKVAPRWPEEAFRKALISYITVADGASKPFSAPVEADLLRILRQRQVWPCFENRFHQESGKPVLIGSNGIRCVGYHERRGSEGVPLSGTTSAASSSSSGFTPPPETLTVKQSNTGRGKAPGPRTQYTAKAKRGRRVTDDKA